MANKKGSHQLHWQDRIKLEALKRAKIGVCKIAELLGVHRNTITNELKRGQYEHLNSDYTTEMRYSPEIAQAKAEENLRAKGPELKIGSDMEYASYIESKILNDGYSPAAVLGELKAQGKEDEFKTKVCVTTLYSYIDKGIFLSLSNKNLPVKREEKKRGYRKIRRQKRTSAGDSIDERPEEVENREEFGHWEMDSVLGKKGVSKSTLLVLTERKTREEIVVKLPDHTDEAVVDALDGIERQTGTDLFRRMFKTITVDNGSEFADVKGLERSALEPGEKRTHLYYCHPYSSWERGSNEVANKMIRRKIPKGSNFDGKTDEEIKEVEEWINAYPRRIHGYRSAGELFAEEMRSIA